MTGTLDNVLETLRAHEGELRRFGVSHAAVFGSVARGEARADSDIDVLVDLDRNRPIGIFEYAYARLKIYTNGLLDGAGDVVNRDAAVEMAAPPLEGEVVLFQSGFRAALEPVHLSGSAPLAGEPPRHAAPCAAGRTAYFEPGLIWTGDGGL